VIHQGETVGGAGSIRSVPSPGATAGSGENSGRIQWPVSRLMASIHRVGQSSQPDFSAEAGVMVTGPDWILVT
jgi:hypothetical protein